MKITIDVTKEDIERGQRGSCMKCPIAIAALRATNSKYISVESDSIDVQIGKNVLTAALPESAVHFISDFDYQGKVSPFSFEFELPN